MLWNYLKTSRSRATTENCFLACFPTIELPYCQITLMHVDFPPILMFSFFSLFPFFLLRPVLRYFTRGASRRQNRRKKKKKRRSRSFDPASLACSCSFRKLSVGLSCVCMPACRKPYHPAFFFIAPLAKKLNVRWHKLKNTLKNASIKHHDASALGSIAAGIRAML